MRQNTKESYVRGKPRASSLSVKNNLTVDRATWASLSPEQKMNSLQKWTDHLSDSLGIKRHALVLDQSMDATGKTITAPKQNHSLGYDNANFAIKDGSIKIGNKTLSSDYSFYDALEVVMEETSHAADIEMMDSLFSITRGKELTPAEKEHALRIFINTLYYDVKAPDDVYAWQYMESSSKYFARYFKKQIGDI